MGIEEKAGNLGVVTTSLEYVVNWGRTNAMWPLLFGLALTRWGGHALWLTAGLGLLALGLLQGLTLRLARVTAAPGPPT